MKIAVEGCAHGELDKIYETLSYIENANRFKVDLLIICGDFQAVRNKGDLQCMAVPPKYQKLNSFYKYYSGEKVAPVLTIFIGGNHEASNYLSELPFGGWVCKNIYYMGYAGVIRVGGIRIAGLSGIYKGQDYLKGHFECPPYDGSTKRSIYHIRNFDVFRLKQLKQPIDVFISHDWPRGIYNYGEKERLLKNKPFFKDEVERNELGSRPAQELLELLKPSYWFAAHLHCKFSALVPHSSENEGRNYTKFLALDKCLPRRDFLQILDIGDSGSEISLQYDQEWLCVLRSTDHLLSVKKTNNYMPGPGCTERWNYTPSKEEMSQVEEILKNSCSIPENFYATAPFHDETQNSHIVPKVYINSQTTIFCETFGVTDPLTVLSSKDSSINIVSKDFTYVEDVNITNVSKQSINPDEIDVDENLSDELSADSSNFINTPGENLSSDNCDGLYFVDRIGDSGNLDSSSQSEEISLEKRQSLHTEYCTTSTPLRNEVSLDNLEFPEYKLQVKENNQADPLSSPAQKKFKRRNESIYMDSGNDSDSK